jgi:hypothetical protein
VADHSVSYAEGPRVSNFAWSVCSEWSGTKQAAQVRCNADPNCTVVYDWSCDGVKWRYCSGPTIATVAATGPDTDACTMVKAFVDAGPVTNAAFAGCSDWAGSLLEAQARCNADPACSMVHDFNCDGWSWRYCIGKLESHTSRGSDTSGCGMVKAHALAYTDGPRVSNQAIDHCSTWTGTLPEAHARCESDPLCASLFDWRCDGLHWRTCSTTISEMRAISDKVDSCTKVPI